MALLDTIKSRLSNPAQSPPLSPGQGQVQSVRNILQAKTGKAAPASPSGPRQTNLQEQVQTQLTKETQRQSGLRGQIQGEQLQQGALDIEQQESQQEERFEDTRKSLQEDLRIQTNQLLNQFASGQKTLKTQEDIQDLEQLGFQTRLQNQKYINQLQDVGKRSRLDNMLEFKKQMAENIFQDQRELLEDQIAFNEIVNADDRQFAEELADMDINYAMQVAENAAKTAATQQVVSGIGSLVSGAVQGVRKGIFKSTDKGAPIVGQEVEGES